MPFGNQQIALAIGVTTISNLCIDRERLRRLSKSISNCLAPPVWRRSCTRWCVTAPGESCWAFAVFYAKLLKMLASGVPSTHRMTFVYTKSSHLHAARNPTSKYEQPARKGAALDSKKAEVRKVLCAQSLSMRPCDELGAELVGMIGLSRDDVCVVPPRAAQFASQAERNRCAHGVRDNAVCFGA